MAALSFPATPIRHCFFFSDVVVWCVVVVWEVEVDPLLSESGGGVSVCLVSVLVVVVCSVVLVVDDGLLLAGGGLFC